MRSYRTLTVLLAAILVLGIATPAVAGNVDKPRPFHGIYVGSGEPPVPTIACDAGEIPFAGVGTGYANHLGDYTWHAEYCMGFIDPSHVTASGYVTAVAANGDLLYGTMTAEGEFLPDGTMVNTQDLAYEGGSGRFEHAIGSATAVGVIHPDGTSYNTFEGVLAFDASDRSQ